jgi:hypothetical protein
MICRYPVTLGRAGFLGTKFDSERWPLPVTIRSRQFGRTDLVCCHLMAPCMGLLSNQIAALLERARQCYADARVCDNAKLKRELVAKGDDYFRQAKEMQRKQADIDGGYNKNRGRRAPNPLRPPR